MKKSIGLVILIWISIVGIFFIWDYLNFKVEQKRISLETARTFFDQIVITREWNALQGGVYAPVSEHTQPNPYLDEPGRDIRINQNLVLTRVNPAYMTRQISQIAAKRKGVHFHITSLNPIRPANKPSDLETEALQSFRQGNQEYVQYIRKKSGDSIFYMAPLRTKEVCLNCHARQGYKLGDIRGGISVSLPFVPRISRLSLLVGHAGIGLAGVFGILVFGSKLNKSYTTIKKQAKLDAMTGIPNRLSFAERIDQEFDRCLREKASLSLIICDIDHFKAYNDCYGHNAGDKCLIQVAGVIQNSLKRPADFCARYGGEEFVIVLPHTGLKGALHVAKRIRSNIQALRIVHEKSASAEFVSLSLGLASVNDCSSLSHEQLLIHADQAMYMAKAKGRNRVQVFEEKT